MKTLLHFISLGCLVLLFAGACEAQVNRDNFYRPWNNFYNRPTLSNAFGDHPGTGSWLQLQTQSGDVHYSYIFAQGDGGNAATQFMSYDQALALGRETLASASQPKPQAPLGDVARALQPKGNSAATPQPQKIITQDNQGRLVVCDANGKNCQELPPKG
jgi:hypothetical protein